MTILWPWPEVSLSKSSLNPPFIDLLTVCLELATRRRGRLQCRGKWNRQACGWRAGKAARVVDPCLCKTTARVAGSGGLGQQLLDAASLKNSPMGLESVSWVQSTSLLRHVCMQRLYRRHHKTLRRPSQIHPVHDRPSTHITTDHRAKCCGRRCVTRTDVEDSRNAEMSLSLGSNIVYIHIKKSLLIRVALRC
ncbi:hypothetical protein CONLIGDRAFT_424818 [Coniochaeta ligniaria NRRL 30616]|uniref:Uncharacterized protein n=1 Tax=Coniochaeta ligniaria NRRL 30616 TaxID=1408157 RepID=A0A1J7JC52_9PEZI|nr:hypothetical protein CONLIGDRAFT_424818 [Coniochaeta ligniaria NRRL 30616]